MSQNFSDWMSDVQARVESALSRALPAAESIPARLHQAMRYSTLGGGKRVRPLLAFAAGEITGAAPEALDAAACAVECIHVYSLVHDDLPCMDDDVLRRGRPTCHVEFDEPTALLVGDSMQTLALEILEVQRRAAVAFHDGLVRDLQVAETLFPPREAGIARHAQAGADDALVSAALRRHGPVEERDVGSGRGESVRVEQMVRGNVILVDRFLHEPEAQRSRIERVIARDVGGDGGEVMEASELHPAKVRMFRRSSSEAAPGGTIQLRDES